jgi:hypothetical protein
MTTVTEIIVTEQVAHLREIAAAKVWGFEETVEGALALSIPAKDLYTFGLLVELDDFPVLPPSWHWKNLKTNALDQLADTPKGSGYLHSSGRICAPWNRLAYNSYDPKGPHGDWILTNWMTNPKTFNHFTLSSMALRIFVELNSARYQGRMG